MMQMARSRRVNLVALEVVSTHEYETGLFRCTLQAMIMDRKFSSPPANYDLTIREQCKEGPVQSCNGS